MHSKEGVSLHTLEACPWFAVPALGVVAAASLCALTTFTKWRSCVSSLHTRVKLWCRMGCAGTCAERRGPRGNNAYTQQKKAVHAGETLNTGQLLSSLLRLTFWLGEGQQGPAQSATPALWSWLELQPRAGRAPAACAAGPPACTWSGALLMRGAQNSSRSGCFCARDSLQPAHALQTPSLAMQHSSASWHVA